MERAATEKTPLPRGLFFGPAGPRWPLVAAILLVCLLPFLPGLPGPFQLDDTINLQAIHPGDGSPLAVLDAAHNPSAGPLGRPLSNLTLIANQALHGYAPLGYKATNLALHAVVGALVYVFLLQLLAWLKPAQARLERRWIALLASAIWTIHPLQVSTALYVVQRMTELASALMLVAVMYGMRALDARGALPTAASGVRHALAVGAISVMALLSKETGVLVPFLLLAIGLAIPAQTRALATDTLGKRWFWGAAVLAPVAAAIGFVVLSWDRIASGYAMRHFTLAERVLTEPYILGGYLKSFFVPSLRDMGLFLDATPVVSPGDPLGWLGAAALVLVVGVAAIVRSRAPVFAFATFWFVACHLLESSFVPLELAFEHRNYLALVGPAVLLASGIAGLARITRPGLALFAAIAVALTLGGATFVRASNWADQYTFLETSIRHHPDSVRAQTEYAVLESMEGNNDAAIARVLAVRAKNPDLFFPMAMDMDFGCAVPGYAPDWARILDLVRDRPRDLNITAYYKSIASKVIAGQCEVDIRQDFARHLDDVIEVYRNAGRPNEVQFFLMVKADMQPGPESTRALLHEAAAAAPSNPAALYRLAYFELNEGNVAGAEAAIQAIDARTPWWSPSRHRIRELERFSEDLRSSRAGATPP